LKERSVLHNITIQEQHKEHQAGRVRKLPDVSKVIKLLKWLFSEIFKKTFDFCNFFFIKLKKFLKNKILN
jgi:hypothetical protein